MPILDADMTEGSLTVPQYLIFHCYFGREQFQQNGLRHNKMELTWVDNGKLVRKQVKHFPRSMHVQGDLWAEAAGWRETSE